MTPEEKAKEIFNKMFDQRIAIAGAYTIFKGVAKSCAIISVDEMISVLDKLRKPEYTTFIEWDQLTEKDIADTMDGYEVKEYWQQVKQAIEKM